LPITLSSVDLPEPFGPVTVRLSPAARSKPISAKTASPPRSPLRFSAISRMLSPSSITKCRYRFRIAANLRFMCLELFQETLYMRNNHASGRCGKRICAEPAHAPP
jgi:hypothetical protein